jgi:hypothetical protein
MGIASDILMAIGAGQFVTMDGIVKCLWVNMYRPNLAGRKSIGQIWPAVAG